MINLLIAFLEFLLSVLLNFMVKACVAVTETEPLYPRFLIKELRTPQYQTGGANYSKHLLPQKMYQHSGLPTLHSDIDIRFHMQLKPLLADSQIHLYLGSEGSI